MFENIKNYFERKKQFKEKAMALILEIAEEARLEAIATAIEETPSKEDGKMRGKNTISGNLKASWSGTKLATDKNEVYFYLQNDAYYASYVDKGHSMDQHYVLGLYVNPLNGLLEFEPDREKAIREGLGIMVGTKTSWVEGLDMTGKAKETFNEYMKRELGRRMKELWENT